MNPGTGTGTGDGGKVDSVTFLSQHITRPLITILLVLTFCYGFIVEKISGETFGTIVASVVSFWFAQRSQETRATDRAAADTPGATATAPPTGGTATASVTPSPPKEE